MTEVHGFAPALEPEKRPEAVEQHKRERLSIWKIHETPMDEQAIGPESFKALYNKRGNSINTAQKRVNVSHILNTEEKEEQGTVLLMNLKVTVEGAQSPHRQCEFEEKKVHICGDKVPENFLTKLGIAVTCKKGLKPESPNQDDYSILIDERTLLLGVFDGHGQYGHNVSNFIHTLLPKLVMQKEALKADAGRAFATSFQECQGALELHCEQANAAFDCVLSGSTASLVLIVDEKIVTAHVGDSRAVLSRKLPSGEREAVVLTPDHKPTLPEERTRIESTNGEVKKLSNDTLHRVFVRGRDFPGLAMSRSIGDMLSRGLGVVSEPTVSERKISAEDEFVLVCSDGVWEFISNEEAVNLVARFGRGKVVEAAEQLAKKAWKLWIHHEGDVVDDITVIVAYLPHSTEPSASEGNAS